MGSPPVHVFFFFFEGHGGSLIHPPPPGFRVTQIPGCFIGQKEESDAYLDTLRFCTFGWFVPWQRAGGDPQSVSSTTACDSLRIGFCQVLNRGLLHLDFEVLQWSKLVEKLGYTKLDEKHAPSERLHLTCEQLQRLTSNYGRRN